MRKHKIKMLSILSGFFLLQLAFWGMSPSTAQAGGTIKIDDTRSITVGMGLRTEARTQENNPNDGFSLGSFRFYLSGQLHQIVSFEFNADFDTAPAGSNTEDIRVLDAVLKFAFHDLFQVWTGRFIPPSDRSNLSGPYYLNAWDFPFVQKYPAVFAGRDDGIAIFGQVGGGMFKYQAGVFEGKGDVTTAAPNRNDSLLYAGRLTLNLLDPEPGYYNSSTYYGSKDVFAIGLVFMSQKDTEGTTATPGNFNGWNLDLLAEKNIPGAGVLTFEGAYYEYDADNVGVLATTPGTDGPEGKGYFILGSLLLPHQFSVGALQGKLQPMLRYQEFKNEGLTRGYHTRLDIAVSHIIEGHNARITFTYSMDEDRTGLKSDIAILGLQFQA